MDRRVKCGYEGISSGICIFHPVFHAELNPCHFHECFFVMQGTTGVLDNFMNINYLRNFYVSRVTYLTTPRSAPGKLCPERILNYIYWHYMKYSSLLRAS
jgi:hypothetical protein